MLGRCWNIQILLYKWQVYTIQYNHKLLVALAIRKQIAKFWDHKLDLYWTSGQLSGQLSEQLSGQLSGYCQDNCQDNCQNSCQNNFSGQLSGQLAIRTTVGTTVSLTYFSTWVVQDNYEQVIVRGQIMSGDNCQDSWLSGQLSGQLNLPGQLSEQL